MTTLIRIRDISVLDTLTSLQLSIAEHRRHPMNATEANEFMNNVESALNIMLPLERIPEPILANHEIRNLQQQAEEAEQNLTVAETVTTELRHQLGEARAIQMTLAGTRPIEVSAMKISDPDKFDGNRDHLRNFLLQIRLKAGMLPDDQTRLRYAISLLKGPALDQVAAYIQNDRIDLSNLDQLTRILETAFGDPDRKSTAETKLLTIRQANRDFSTYFAEFQRYASEVEWNSSAKLARLRNGLSQEILNDLITITEPVDFTEFAALCQRLDNKRRALTTSRRPFGPTRPTPNTRPPVTLPPTSPPVLTTHTTATGTHSGPMDLSAGRRRLSPEERARRMVEGRCLYCGGMGHMAKECTLAKRPLRASAVVTGSGDTENVPHQSEN